MACFCMHMSEIRSSPYIQYNQEVHACYESIIRLQIEDAQGKLIKLKMSQKENLALIHLENYIDFFYLFITESRKEYNQRIRSKKERIDLLDDIRLKDPHLDFIKAEILLQWALIDLKFDEKLAAGKDIYSAYKLLEGNKKKYPNFLENNKSLSILHALAESVPKWVRKIIGVKGSLITGYEEIERLADFAYKDDNYFYREEIAAIYTYILFYQMNKREVALLQFDRFHLDHTRSPLLAFLKASMYLRAGKNDQSLQVLSELKQNSTHPFKRFRSC
ncbi:MAG: hypothetical protein IPN29_19160 [Saprospiraceae bacterium]|nr:hypothetical protein [Saprospiraceae bacterium]